jgi:predicted nucleic acid-binding protein
VIAYAESSAVLSWILSEAKGDAVRRALADAERVVSSTLTQVECARALSRAVGMGRMGRGEELAALRLMDAAAARWAVLEMSGKVLARARGAFPVEPVRTPDALHLATALLFREALPDLLVVSLDERFRANAEALGLPVAP